MTLPNTPQSIGKGFVDALRERPLVVTIGVGQPAPEPGAEPAPSEPSSPFAVKIPDQTRWAQYRAELQHTYELAASSVVTIEQEVATFLALLEQRSAKFAKSAVVKSGSGQSIWYCEEWRETRTTILAAYQRTVYRVQQSMALFMRLDEYVVRDCWCPPVDDHELFSYRAPSTTAKSKARDVS
jgi:hypothetical protein